MGAILGQPATPEQTGTQAKLPPIRNRWRFLYRWHPTRWEFSPDDLADGGDGWLPQLSQLNITPGAGGVADNGNTDLAIVQAQRDGWQIIRPDHPKLKQSAFANYLHKFPSRGRSPVWASMFESVNMVGNRAIWKGDPEAFRRFRRYLVDSGIVGPIDPLIKEEKVDDIKLKLDRMLERHASSGGNNPRRAKDIERWQKVVDLLDGTAAEPEPEPKPKRSTRSKS